MYVNAARRVMGGIDLDPATTLEANLGINADVFYDPYDDGLYQSWVGRVWLNPPYGRGITIRWIRKLVNEYACGNVEQAVLLINNTTDRKWFRPLWDHSICFVYKRISFIDPIYGKGSQPTHGNVFVYFGERGEYCNARQYLFAKVFEKFGHIAISGKVRL